MRSNDCRHTAGTMFNFQFLNRGREKKSQGSILFGLFLLWAGLTALWKNEVRFDLTSAAIQAPYTATTASVFAGENFSYSGRLDPNLKVSDDHVAPIVGYMSIKRVAEIYAWDRETQSDGPDRWTLEWQRYPESNNRNAHLQQRLSSKHLLPREHKLDGLRIRTEDIRFVDAYRTIAPRRLSWRDRSLRPSSTSSQYFQFPVAGSTNGGTQLGDERLSYVAIPVPPLATYFGQFDGEAAVVDDSNRQTGMINSLIQNEGLLHHLVSGDRETAIDSIKADQAKIKWYARLGGTVAVIVGIQLFLAKIFGLLLMIPFIGRMVERAVSLASTAIGLVLSAITIGLGYIAAHPLVLVIIGVSVAAVFYLLRRRADAQQMEARSSVEAQYKTQLQAHSLAEIEFIELARLAALEDTIGDEEHKMLLEWSRERGWSRGKCDSLLSVATASDNGFLPRGSTPLMVANLVRIALADGTLSARELDRIKAIAHRAGLKDNAVEALIKQEQQSIASVAP